MGSLAQFSLYFLFPFTALLCLWGGLLIVLRNLHNARALPAGIGLMLWSVPYVLRTLKTHLDESVLPWLMYTGIVAYLVFGTGIVLSWIRGSANPRARRQCLVGFVLLILISLSLLWEFTVSAEPALIVRSILLIIVGVLSLWDLGFRRFSTLRVDDRKPAVHSAYFEDHLAPRMSEYAAVVKEWFENDKPYLDPALKLSDTTVRLPLNRSYLSRVYNEGLGKSFSEMVRDYRLGYATDLLRNDAGISVGDVAKKSGFGSLSSFHRSFTAVYGIPPVEYRARCAKNHAL